MARTTFSLKTSGSPGYHVIEGKEGRLVAGPDFVTFYPKGYAPGSEVVLTWTEAWVLFKFLGALDEPQVPLDSPPTKL